MSGLQKLASLIAIAAVVASTLPVFGQAKPRRIFREKAEIRFPALSPSGETVVFSIWNEKRYAHRLRIVRIEKRAKSRDGDLGVGTAWASNGRSVLYYSEAKNDGNYWLTVADFRVANPRDLGIKGANPQGNPPSWSPDGSQILVINSSGSYLVPAAGGEARRISAKTLGNPSWAPDGKKIAFESKGGGIAVIDLATGEIKNVTRRYEGNSGVFSPDGRHIAWVHEYEVTVLEIATGDRTRVGEGTRAMWTHSGAGLLLFTESGTFTEVGKSPVSDLKVSWVELGGQAQPIQIAKVHEAMIAADGRTLVFAVHGDGLYRMKLPAIARKPSSPTPIPTGPPARRPTNRTIDPDTLKAIQ